MKSFPMIKNVNRLRKQNKQGAKTKQHDYKLWKEEHSKWYAPPAAPEPTAPEPVAEEQTTK